MRSAAWQLARCKKYDKQDSSHPTYCALQMQGGKRPPSESDHSRHLHALQDTAAPGCIGGAAGQALENSKKTVATPSATPPAKSPLTTLSAGSACPLPWHPDAAWRWLPPPLLISPARRQEAGLSGLPFWHAAACLRRPGWFTLFFLSRRIPD